MLGTRLALVLVVTAALSAPLVSSTTAAAAEETCQGETATIVGDGSRDPLQGTDGPDVIVSNGSLNVGAGAGDDLVCITGTVPAGESVDVNDGAGDDEIHNLSPTTDAPMYFDLAEGDDTFVGGPGLDRIRSTGGADIITAGAGDDRVFLGYSPTAGPAQIGGGDGADELTVHTFRGSDDPDIMLDASGTVVFDDEAAHHFVGFERFVTHSRGGQTATMIGTDGPEHLTAYGCELEIQGGGGDDRLELTRDADETCAARSVAYGGLGNDILTGFRDGDRLFGEDGDDILKSVRTLHADGGAGDDEFRGGHRGDTLEGGLGNDLLKGYAGNDILLGSTGDDEARGGTGYDRCRAEVRVACERR